MGITKPSTHLHPAISTSTQLHPPPLSSFQPPPSSLQYPQQYLNQNIALNWAISPNLGRKIENCPFCLKISTHGILEPLIPNLDLDLWNSDPKIDFCANLGPKIQSFLFCLKIGTHSISKMLIPNPDLDFWNSDPKIHFWVILVENVKVICFSWKLARMASWRCWFLFQHYFSEFPTLNPFLGKFGPKKSKLFILPENWYTCYLGIADFCSKISFLNFKI